MSNSAIPTKIPVSVHRRLLSVGEGLINGTSHIKNLRQKRLPSQVRKRCPPTYKVRYKAYILFTARQMVRPSETRALFWEDLDLKHNQVVIRRHFSLNELRMTTKSKRIKALPLDGGVKETLLKLPQHITSPFVFQKNGKPYSESYARKLWNRITSEIGIKICFYRGTRHSSATEAVNRVGMDKVQEFLGHTRPTMTRRYARMNTDGLKEVLRKK